MKPYNAHMTIRTCHDIRRMVSCCHCNGIGDKAAMLLYAPAPASTDARVGFDYLHGRCFIRLRGMSAFLELRIDQTDKLTLDDIGVTAMRALMEKR